MKFVLLFTMILSSTISHADFELVQLGTMRRDQYLIDKKTGRVWVKTCMYSKPGNTGADCDYAAWTKEDVQGLNGATAGSIDSYVKELRKNNQ